MSLVRWPILVFLTVLLSSCGTLLDVLARASSNVGLSYQTLCATHTEEFRDFKPASQPLVFEKIGKPSENSLTAITLLADDGLIYTDLTAGLEGARQYVVESKSFKSTPSFSCERFHAYGYTFEVLSNSVTACQDSKCVSISSRGSYAFSYAASNESVFVGTNWGEAFLFHNSQWCQMIENDNKYACDDSNPSPDTSPGRQWYSSTPFGADALVGEYRGVGFGGLTVNL